MAKAWRRMVEKLLKSSKRWWITWSFLVVSTATADNQCSQKTRWPETELCKTPLLATLDRQLNDIYRQAQTVVVDKSVLRQEQRKWLQTVRNPCPDLECLMTVYQHRVAELSLRFINAAPITNQLLSNSDARETCEAVADMASRGSLAPLEIPGFRLDFVKHTVPKDWALSTKEQAAFNKQLLQPQQVYRLRLQSSQQHERFISLADRGSAHSESIIHLRFALNAKDAVDPVPDPNELIRWTHWGGKDYPIHYKKRMYLVTSDISDPNSVNMVSWIKPDGHSRPLCLIEAEPSRLSVASAEQPELCTSIAGGKLSPLTWIDASERLGGEGWKRYGERGDRLDLLKLDLDSDGRPENVGRFLYNSMAGTGGVRVWLALLSDDLSSKIRTILDEGVIGTDRDSLNIYSAQGQYYISLHDTIVQLRGDQIRKICEFDRVTPRKVSTFFEVAP